MKTLELNKKLLPYESKAMTGCKEIDNLDLFYVLDRLILSGKWTRKHAYNALAQYKRFLFLIKKYGENNKIAPSQEIDEVWHEHILFTKQYQEDCLNIFGFYIHHNPNETSKTSIDENSSTKFIETLSLYRKEYGEELCMIRHFFIIEKIVYFSEKFLIKIKKYYLKFIKLFE